jgi:3-carboxy-cis,cis-muconate cycloisomerase
MVQEHERAVGGWQAEWAALPDLFRYTAGAVGRVHAAVAGLQIDPDRMCANLDLTAGLIMAESLAMALAPHLGKQEAHHAVQAACARAREVGTDLLQEARVNPQISAALSPEAIERALDPATYLGSTDTFITRALDDFRQLRSTD